jgi:hypothetical protein
MSADEDAQLASADARRSEAKSCAGMKNCQVCGMKWHLRTAKVVLHTPKVVLCASKSRLNEWRPPEGQNALGERL